MLLAGPLSFASVHSSVATWIAYLQSCQWLPSTVQQVLI